LKIYKQVWEIHQPRTRGTGGQ